MLIAAGRFRAGGVVDHCPRAAWTRADGSLWILGRQPAQGNGWRVLTRALAVDGPKINHLNRPPGGTVDRQVRLAPDLNLPESTAVPYRCRATAPWFPSDNGSTFLREYFSSLTVSAAKTRRHLGRLSPWPWRRVHQVAEILSSAQAADVAFAGQGRAEFAFDGRRALLNRPAGAGAGQQIRIPPVTGFRPRCGSSRPSPPVAWPNSCNRCRIFPGLTARPGSSAGA